MNIREDVIYARQSVDRKDSISIESQIDFCKYELKGGSCRVFKDKGYSGKNTDRPEFQKLLGEIRKGKVRRVVVYKLDRISRSILDFANMMELFQEYDVEFVSSTEKFDTSTPMGRAMLNICIVFAQLERETIQKRVTDAYYSRCLKGFHMSGQAPYGFDLEPTVVENIRTKMMVADPIAASHVRLMFEMYAEPETSFGDITRYFEERGIKVYGKSLTRSYLSRLLRNPVYAQADLEMYEFFKSQGTVVVNDAADFAAVLGTNRHNIAAGADGNHSILQKFVGGRVFDDGIQLGADAVLRRADLAAQVAQGDGGGIGHFFRRNDALADLLFQHRLRSQGKEQVIGGQHIVVGQAVPLGQAGKIAQRCSNFQQLAHRKNAALGRMGHHAAHFMHSAKARAAVFQQEGIIGVGLGQGVALLLRCGKRLNGAHHLFGFRTGAQLHRTGINFIQFLGCTVGNVHS